MSSRYVVGFTDVVQLLIVAGLVMGAFWMRRLRRAQAEILQAQVQVTQFLKEHREQHQQAAAAGRPPANFSWYCPACGLRGIGHAPESIDVVFACPVCSVQAKVVRPGGTEVSGTTV